MNADYSQKPIPTGNPSVVPNVDRSQIPIISLAGVTCLSDVLSELPVPTPSIELIGGKTETLFFHQRVADEAAKYVNSADPNLVSVVSSLLSSTNADNVVVKDEYAAASSSMPAVVDIALSEGSNAPALLKNVLRMNPSTFGSRCGGDQNGQQRKHPHQIRDLSQVVGHIQDESASASTSVSSNDYDVKAVKKPAEEDEIPTHLKHLFRQEPIVQIEPIEMMRMNANASGSASRSANTTSESMKKRIVSIGKQPKAPSHGSSSATSAGKKNKRTMVSELFDSLTPAAEYFAEGSRRRRTVPKNYNERPLNAEGVIDEISGEQDSNSCDSAVYMQGNEQGGAFVDASGNVWPGKPPAHKKARKDSKSHGRGEDDDTPYDPQADLQGPETPTDEKVEDEREKEWQAIIKKRREKRRRRTERAGGIYQMIDPDELVENESYRKFCAAIDTVFDNAEDVDISAETGDDEDEIPAECLIPKHVMMELCSEANKLKILGAMNRVPIDRLTKLITVLEKNVKDGAKVLPYLDEKADADESAAWREAMTDRVLRSADAALIALTVMTSPAMPKPVFIEDAIERSVAFVKFQLQNVVFPAFDPLYRAGREKSGADGDNADVSGTSKQKRSRGSSAASKNKILQNLYGKISELIGCFADLVEAQMLTDTTVLQLSSLGVTPFFVENINELQLHALRLVSNIFGRYPKHRKLILEDILASLARLPSTKRGMRSYRLNATEYIQMVSALVMQLVQSVVRIPICASKSSGGDYEDGGHEADVQEDPDVVVNTSFDNAMRTAHTFLAAYLKKCTTKSEEDYRPLFEAFVEDLLTAVHKPDWPAAELLLSLLGNLLVQHFSNKQIEMSLRVASLDYLGVVASRLRKDAVASQMDAAQLQQILQKATEGGRDEDEDIITAGGGALEHKRIRIRIGSRHRPDAGGEDKIQMLQKALMDYLTDQKESDSTVEFAKNFYIAQWYKDCTSETTKQKSKSGDENEPYDDDGGDKKSSDKRAMVEQDQLDGDAQKIAAKKQFLLSLSERETNAEYGARLRRDGPLLSEAEAAFLVRYLASKRPLSQSFDIYLAQILRVLNETAVAVRTKAMKCLSAVVEADPSVLGRADIQQAVRARLLDQSSSVREAAVDLIGKFICAQPDFIDKYYKMVLDRILDTGVSVRKRVIKILKDICERRPDFEKIPEICVRILKRANDEESVKKLVVETFHGLWFLPVRERDTATLLKKVMTIIDVIGEYGRESGSQYEGFEALLSSLLRKDAACEKGALTAAGQIVNCLVENVLPTEERSMDTSSRLTGHNRLLSCLTTLYLFSKVHPPLMVTHAETMQPYLHMDCSTKHAQAVLVQVVKILEMVVPLMEHPNPAFLSELEGSLIRLALRHGPAVIQACISCLSAVVNGLTKNYELIQTHFFKLFSTLLKLKGEVECASGSSAELAKMKPSLMRTIFTLGLFCRYFDLDETYPEDKRPETPWKEQVFRAFVYFTGQRDEETKLKAFAALGALCIKHPDIMMREELKRLYCASLLSRAKGGHHQSKVHGEQESFDEKLKSQVLRNIQLFLKEEEAKLMKSNEQWDNSKMNEDLKELCESASGLGSSVIQHYLRDVEESFFHPSVIVRSDVCEVVILTLQQGLVHPVQCIPHVIAMQTDIEPAIRTKADKILKEVETKYPGFIQMKAGEGLKLSFRLQTIICRSKEESAHQQQSDTKPGKARQQQAPAPLPGAGARGLRFDQANGPQALNSHLYSLIRSGRTQRRAFLRTLLQLFDENSKTSLEEMIYVVDNLASFPYQVLEEPLFICHHVDIVVSVTGASLVQTFQEGLLPKTRPQQPRMADPNAQYDPTGGMQAGMYYGMDPTGMGMAPNVEIPRTADDDDDEDDQTPEDIMARFPADYRHLEDCMANGQGCLMLLSLKQYLKDVYGITDSKLQEYSPSESAKAYDKALNRRPTVPPFQPRYFLIGAAAGAWNSPNADVERRYRLCQQYIEFKQLMMSIDTSNTGYASDEEANAAMSAMDQQSAQMSEAMPTKKRKTKGAAMT